MKKLTKIKQMLTPTPQKIYTTLAAAIFMAALLYSLVNCFPLRIFWSLSARDVIANKPWCVIWRNPVVEPIAETFGAILIYPYVLALVGIYLALSQLPLGDELSFYISLALFLPLVLFSLYAGSCCLLALIKKTKSK